MLTRDELSECLSLALKLKPTMSYDPENLRWDPYKCYDISKDDVRERVHELLMEHFTEMQEKIVNLQDRVEDLEPAEEDEVTASVNAWKSTTD